jgi:hypothetical protein
MGEDLDKLFEKVQRSPFREDAVDRVTTEEDTFPLTAAGPTEDQHIPMQIQGMLIGGVDNDRFVQGPPDGDSTVIDNISNKLPGWKFGTTAANAATCTWQYDGTNPPLTFSITDGTDGERIWIEQDVFIQGGNITVKSPAFLAYTEDLTHLNGWLSYQYMDADGTLQGSEQEDEYTTTTDTAGLIHRVFLMARTWNYVYVRLKFGFEVKTTWSTGADYWGKIKWGWLDIPTFYDTTLVYEFDTNFTYVAGAYDNSYPLQGSVAAAANRVWVPSTPGVFIANSVNITNAPSGDWLQFHPRVGAIAKDPECQLAVGETKGWHGRNLEGVRAFDFDGGESVGMGVIAGSSYSDTDVGGYGTIVARCFFNNAAGSGGGGIGPAGS